MDGQETSSQVIPDLEQKLAQKDTELAQHRTRLTELEQTLAGRESELVTAMQAESARKERLAMVEKALDEAVTSYRALVIQSHPGIMEELIGGESIAAINESLEKAKSLVSRVRQSVEKEISLTRVPAGAPGRQSPDFSGLTPKEKIQYAIGGKR